MYCERRAILSPFSLFYIKVTPKENKASLSGVATDYIPNWNRLDQLKRQLV